MPIASRFLAAWLAGSNGFAAVKTIRTFSGVITSTSRVPQGVSRGSLTAHALWARHAATSESIWFRTHAKLKLTVGTRSGADAVGISRTSWNAHRRRCMSWLGTLNSSKKSRPRVQKSTDAPRSVVGIVTNDGIP